MVQLTSKIVGLTTVLSALWSVTAALSPGSYFMENVGFGLRVLAGSSPGVVLAQEGLAVGAFPFTVDSTMTTLFNEESQQFVVVDASDGGSAGSGVFLCNTTFPVPPFIPIGNSDWTFVQGLGERSRRPTPPVVVRMRTVKTTAGVGWRHGGNKAVKGSGTRKGSNRDQKYRSFLSTALAILSIWCRRFGSLRAVATSGDGGRRNSVVGSWYPQGIPVMSSLISADVVRESEKAPADMEHGRPPYHCEQGSWEKNWNEDEEGGRRATCSWLEYVADAN
ncbi:hypothetical protein GALMADRAFT_213935 [Galerina marginata CBS 339.88]|uniref:Uncharacterized protein n=1 Tax=Galerina marginata (strain CBS 339.88) TaxID=685588 RepID=A0A067SJS3_GALM3|nr:hypothetical protein GALMADRAFT_213935 [Galerina marginata CBS 339.88]